MIRINLLPLKEAQRAIGRRRQVSIALLSVAVALLMMVIPYMLQGRQLTRLASEIDQLQAEVAKLDAQAKEVRDLDKKRADLRAKLKVIDDLKRKRVGPVRILEDLSGAAPEKLWLVDFTDVGATATLIGMALDNQTIAAFMRQLQSSKYFINVDLVETAQTEAARGTLGGEAGMVFKKFIIKAQLDYLGRSGKPPSGDGKAPAAPNKAGPERSP